jgi:hypothetical protein
LLIIAGSSSSLASIYLRRDLSHTNDFVVLFPLELVGVVAAGILATVALLTRRASADAMLAVGLYILIIAAAIGTLFPFWLPQDNTILGSALLAGVLAGVGAGVALASAAALGQSVTAGRLAIAIVGGVLLAFVLVTAGGMAYPLAQVRLPIVVVALVGLVVARYAWHRRQRLRRPLLQVMAGAAATIALLVIRGPDDWASASGSLKLFSFPILIVALGISLAMYRPLR